ncbi:hypothetical protein PC123_g23597 [Phytophthora cactorum]|nr:hypothetical protein PC120_g23004 [Phytophthora cactorum]KAG4040871.1 hypothetical protein PC123_g23597 [Phytophthora cactorum]
MKYATERLEHEAKLIRSKLRTRVPRGCEEQPPEKPRSSKRYVCVVRDSDRRVRKHGLAEVSADEDDLDVDVHGLVPEGKRVIGSVGGAEAVSAGYIDCLPVEILFDTGAIASLVDHRVLHRIGKAEEPLIPYEQSLRGVGAQNIHIRGIIDLPMRLGSTEMMRPFVVVDRLHADAILGTDALRAFRAVIDLDDSTLTLKSTCEVFMLGSPRVEEMFVAGIGSTVHLPPGG